MNSSEVVLLPEKFVFAIANSKHQGSHFGKDTFIEFLGHSSDNQQ